jgi:hypothetical protein
MKTAFAVLIALTLFAYDAFAFEIRGRVLDEKYFPVPNIRVSISSGGVTKTDKFGVFSLSSESTPYSLYVSDMSLMNAVLYTNLSTATPEIIMFGLPFSRNVNNEIVKVEFPPVQSGRNAILKFVSTDVYYSEDVVASPGEWKKVLNIIFPSYTDRINGKIIYLEKTATAFIRYGEYPVTIIKEGYPQNAYFDSLSGYTNLLEAFVTVYPPAFEFDTKGFTVYGDFLSLHRNAEVTLNITEGDIISSKVIVPQNLPYGFRLKIEGRGGFAKGCNFVSYTYSYPGSTLNISTETAPALEAPQDKYWGVSNNTMFTWNYGSGSGVYIAHFHSFLPVGDMYVVTTDKTIRFPKSYSGNVIDGNEYSWQVLKYLTYTSVDDFVKPRLFINDQGYKAILTSELRTFRINPF